MAKISSKPKRSKALVLLILPAVIFIGFFGWLISALEPSDWKAIKYQAPKTVERRDDGVTFMPAVYEEINEIRVN